jgi:hypothetical protein
MARPIPLAAPVINAFFPRMIFTGALPLSAGVKHSRFEMRISIGPSQAGSGVQDVLAPAEYCWLGRLELSALALTIVGSAQAPVGAAQLAQHNIR